MRGQKIINLVDLEKNPEKSGKTGKQKHFQDVKNLNPDKSGKNPESCQKRGNVLRSKHSTMNYQEYMRK